MKALHGLMAAALALAPALAGTAAPPDNRGPNRAANHRTQRSIERQQQRVQRSIDRQQQRGRDYGQQLRQQRTLDLTRGGRPDSPGRSVDHRTLSGRFSDRGQSNNRSKSTSDTQRGSARSALVNHGQNRLARINADKILANRLAQVARLRDIALNTNNDKLMARADQLEKLAQADYDRRTGDSSSSNTDSSTSPTTDPTTTDPTTTDPTTTDPTTTDPTTTDPTTTDPTTTDPTP